MRTRPFALAVVACCVACGEQGESDSMPSPTGSGQMEQNGEGSESEPEPGAPPEPEGAPAGDDDPTPIGPDDDPSPTADDDPTAEPEMGAGGAGAMPDPTTPAEETCESTSLPSPPLRRLSSDEYHNTLRDLFGEELGRRVVDGSLFPVTQVTSGFTTDAEANIVNTAESNAIEDNAERIAGLIDQDPTTFLRELMPCSLGEGASDGDIDACVDAFIQQFGTRAYRRPLQNSETNLARRVYDEARAAGDARFAFAALVQYFVQSPALLYRVERGIGADDAELLRLDAHERATRLSYFLTGSMPDEELMNSAAENTLRTAAEIRAHAERLLDTDRFLERAVTFHRDWLELHGFDYKEPSLFPSFDAARGSLEQETSRYVRYVLGEGDGSIAAMLGGTTFPMNDALATFYGVNAQGASAEEWVPVEVPNRRGLLTHGALMATLATSTATRPIHRGGFAQTQFLCRELPALPANLDIQSPLVDTSSLPTARERLSPLTQNGDCSVCHTVINPVGLAFEPYDAAGAWRDEENGAVIDASGTLVLDGTDVDFDGPVALAEAIAGSAEAQQCYTLFWYRAAMGRPEYVEDECSIQAVDDAVAASNGDVRELLLALVQTDAFLFRRPHEP